MKKISIAIVISFIVLACENSDIISEKPEPTDTEEPNNTEKETITEDFEEPTFTEDTISTEEPTDTIKECYLTEIRYKDIEQNRCHTSIFEKGLLVQSNMDEGCDNILEYCGYYTNDSYGNYLKIESSETCTKENVNNHKLCYQYEYNSIGQIISTKQTDCADTNFYCTWISYDPEGRIITSKTDNNCDGQFESCYNYEYLTHNENDITKRISDIKCDGVVDSISCTEYEYNENGNTTKIKFGNCEGEDTVTYCYSWYYDKEDNYIKYEADWDCSGSVDHYGEYSWQCV